MSDSTLEAVLASRPCGLLTDIDGTISPIASTPDAAAVSPVAREQLRALAQHLELVGAISGRAATDAAALVGLPDLVYYGNHGLEVWREGQAAPSPEAEPYVAVIEAVLNEAQARIKQTGVLFENKGVTASIHYRLAAQPEVAEHAIEDVLRGLIEQHGLRLTHGRLVWEIRPPLDVNKGTAARALAREYNLRGLIFLGDDRTDADAFAVLRDLREQGNIATLNVGVTTDETPAIVLELADLLVEGVSGVESFLTRAATLVANRGRGRA